MKTLLSSNITRYRKSNGLTQGELGNKLGVTFQAVSKWEAEQAMPDINTLFQLAKVLHVSADKLWGYDAPQQSTGYFDINTAYAKDGYYEGISPSPECLKVVSLLPPYKHLKVMEFACGEGKQGNRKSNICA